MSKGWRSCLCDAACFFWTNLVSRNHFPTSIQVVSKSSRSELTVKRDLGLCPVPRREPYAPTMKHESSRQNLAPVHVGSRLA